MKKTNIPERRMLDYHASDTPQGNATTLSLIVKQILQVQPRIAAFTLYRTVMHPTPHTLYPSCYNTARQIPQLICLTAKHTCVPLPGPHLCHPFLASHASREEMNIPVMVTSFYPSNNIVILDQTDRFN